MDRMIDSRGVRLATESFGTRSPTRPGAPAPAAIVLVMGATASRLGWPDALCAGLAAAGRFVVRYDHRDAGASTTRPPGETDYTIEDLADDLVAVLDAYDLPSAHLVGMSLGGTLSQMVALDHPARVRSLTLIASEPLGWDGPPLPGLSPAILDQVRSPAPSTMRPPRSRATGPAASARSPPPPSSSTAAPTRCSRRTTATPSPKPSAPACT